MIKTQVVDYCPACKLLHHQSCREVCNQPYPCSHGMIKEPHFESVCCRCEYEWVEIRPGKVEFIEPSPAKPKEKSLWCRFIEALIYRLDPRNKTTMPPQIEDYSAHKPYSWKDAEEPKKESDALDFMSNV